MRYPGGKGGAGVYQAIINQFPPHRRYFELFAGGANVWERKAPAASSYLVDRDPATVAALREAFGHRSGVHIAIADAFTVMQGGVTFRAHDLVYLDPPYLHSTRRDLSLYRFELPDDHHAELLYLAAHLPAMVAISGYRSAMYDDASSRYGWRRVDFPAMTRRGPAVESLWCNYPPPADLADFSYVGSGYRERERIKRKVNRWVARWQQLPELERNAIKAAMTAATATAGEPACSTAAPGPAMVATTASYGDGRP